MKKRITLPLLLCTALLLIAALTACSGAFGAQAFGSGGFSGTGETSDTKLSGGSVPQNDEGGQVVFTASFVCNGGAKADGDPILPFDAVEVTSADVPNIYYTGYIFAGWFDSADFSGAQITFETAYILTKNTTFYAKWVTSGVKEIRSVQDLRDINNAMAGSYILMADNLNLKGIDWIPLGMKFKASTKEGSEGKVKLESAITPFTGSFDGNNKTIYGLNLMPSGEEEEYNYLPYGLFSVLGAGGRISNLTLNSFRITLDGDFSDFYIGSLVGQMKGGTVIDCRSVGNINNPKLLYEESLWDDFLGSYATPTANTFIGGMIGGIVAGDVDRCVAEGLIVSESVAKGVFVGGLAGFNWTGNIRNCQTNVNLKGRYAGNLVGYNNGNIYGSFSTGSTAGSMSYPAIAGGLTAYNDINGIIERSYATGAVSARTAGGLVGVNMYNYSKYSPPNIAGDPIISALGLDDEDRGSGTGGIIRNCYAAGNVTANEYAGGLVGRAESIVPVHGKADIKAGVYAETYFIFNCLAFGNVKAVAEEIAYENDKGVLVITKGVYHSVFAGGLIGHASEPKISGCVAFGNVDAISKRPVISGDTIQNAVYADNLIGQSTSKTDYTGGVYEITAVRECYAITGQKVNRNNTAYTGFNTALIVQYSGSNDRNVNTASFYTSRLGFSSAVWNLEDLNIENGKRPFLKP